MSKHKLFILKNKDIKGNKLLTSVFTLSITCIILYLAGKKKKLHVRNEILIICNLLVCKFLGNGTVAIDKYVFLLNAN